MSPSRGGYVGEWTDVVSFLVNLVTDHIAGSVETSAELGVVVFGNALVGFLGGGRGGPLDGFGDVVGGVSMLHGCQCMATPERGEKVVVVIVVVVAEDIQGLSQFRGESVKVSLLDGVHGQVCFGVEKTRFVWGFQR